MAVLQASLDRLKDPSWARDWFKGPFNQTGGRVAAAAGCGPYGQPRAPGPGRNTAETLGTWPGNGQLLPSGAVPRVIRKAKAGDNETRPPEPGAGRKEDGCSGTPTKS